MNFADEIARAFLDGITTDSDPFEEEPVPLDTFLYDAGYLALPVLSEKQFEFLQMMDNDDPKTNTLTEAVLQWGKGSGKDFVSSIFISRRSYKLLCLRNPQRFYSLADRTPIDMLNVAYNASQAYGAFFKQFREIVTNKKVFERFGYEIKTSAVHFAKNITAWSGHSDKEGMEGYNLYAAVADEISAFKTDKELGLEEEDAGTAKAARIKGAESLVRMLRSSITSRFPKVGKLVLLSYPRYSGDYIQTAYEEGKRLKHVFVSFGATFELRPDLTKEDLQKEYDRDPIEAAAKYECKPPHSRSNYHREEQVVHIFDESLRNPFRAGYGGEEDSLAPWFCPTVLGIDEDTPCYIHIDLALNHDSAGFALAYCAGFTMRSIADKWIEEDDSLGREVEKYSEEMIEYKPVITIPLYTKWKAPPRGEIDLSRARKLVVQLRQRGFYIKSVSYDQFQSADSRQILSKLGFKTLQVSVDRDLKAHQALRDLVRDRRLRTHAWSDSLRTVRYKDLFLKGEAEASEEFTAKTLSHLEPLAEELLGLELLNGIKVDHKDEKIGKDMADPVAASAYQCVEGAKRAIEATMFDRSDLRLRRGYAGDLLRS